MSRFVFRVSGSGGAGRGVQVEQEDGGEEGGGGVRPFLELGKGEGCHVGQPQGLVPERRHLFMFKVAGYGHLELSYGQPRKTLRGSSQGRLSRSWSHPFISISYISHGIVNLNRLPNSWNNSRNRRVLRRRMTPP